MRASKAKTIFIAIILMGKACLLNAAESKVHVFFTTNVQGALEPCDCKENQLGGLHRLQRFLQENRGREKNELFLDSGDLFFSSTESHPEKREQEKIKATTIAKAYKLMGLNYLGVGARDLAQGLEEYKKLVQLSGARVVSLNLVDSKGTLLFDAYIEKEINGEKTAITGLVSEKLIKETDTVKIQPLKEAIVKWKNILLEKGIKHSVILSYAGLSEDKEIAKLLPNSFIIGSYSMDILSKPFREGSTFIVQTQNQGQQVGEAVWNLNQRDDFYYQLVDLNEKLDQKNEVASLIKKYKEEIKNIELNKREKKILPSTTNYVANAEKCKNCHEKQYDFWKSTKHASAYLVLFAKNEHFNPECIGCHSLGYKKPGGFTRAAKAIELELQKPRTNLTEEILSSAFEGDGPKRVLDTRKEPERYDNIKNKYHKEMTRFREKNPEAKVYMGVQCENCHNNRSLHLSGERKREKFSDSKCRECHRPPNAPVFATNLIKKVACPLISAP